MMLPLLRQIIAVTKINLLSLPQRIWMSLSAVIAIMFVVLVLLGALALANGFKKALSNSGSDDVAIILRQGSQGEANSVMSREQQQILEAAPGIIKDSKGHPIISPELYVIVDAIKKSTQTKANLSLRGVGLDALGARKGIKIVAGRMFSPGSNEVIVGLSVLKEFDGYVLGQTKRLGQNVWKVVGVFDADGSVFESELWADKAVIQSLFNRGNSVQSIRVRLRSPKAIEQLQAFAKADSRLQVDIKSERAYYSEQSRTIGSLSKIGFGLAIVMSIGALAGALNTMYASVASRSKEIATLRTIGFGGLPTFFATLIESLVLSLCGAVLGAALAWYFFNGMSASTLGSSFTQVVFGLALSGKQLLTERSGQPGWAFSLGCSLPCGQHVNPFWRQPQIKKG
jgi:putative ABC transport system permease protein